MSKTLIAAARTSIAAPRAAVWQALVDPQAIAKYMFGTTVVSNWGVGSAITWKGEWKGKAYEDKGVILALEPGRRLSYSHFSPMSGLADEPANYHTVTIELADEGEGTRVSLMQDNNADEDARVHSEKNWETILQGLKKYVEEATGR